MDGLEDVFAELRAAERELVALSRLAAEVEAGTCVVCGKRFAGRRGDAIYCRLACKQRAYRLRLAAGKS
jgi:hypothetical protein